MPSIAPIPAFEDNYIWLLREPGSSDCVVVDPGDAAPVINRLSAEGLALSAILLTHHHGDHVGGVRQLLQHWPQAEVFGPEDARMPMVTRICADGDRICPPGLSMAFEVLAVPGHTATHIAYLGDGALFCGDTLFAAGCGRVFDGTAEQLAASLRRIAALPSETRCYCAHEYTLANLGFADWVEPESPALAERRREAEALRSAGRPTIPSILALELETNPFLRTAEPGVIAAAESFAGQSLEDQTAVFKALRRWKDERYD